MSSIVRRAGSKLLNLISRAADPGAIAGRFLTYTKTVSGVTQLFGISSDGTVHQITPTAGIGREMPPEMWAQNDVAASQVGVDLETQVSSSFATWKAIRAGSIVGLATRFSEAITDATAGSAIVTVTINGVAGTLLISHSAGSNPSGGQTTQAVGVDTFVAGDLIGIEITTLASFAPITTDLEAYLEIDT